MVMMFVVVLHCGDWHSLLQAMNLGARGEITTCLRNKNKHNTRVHVVILFLCPELLFFSCVVL
jgi:hypothetical protein